MKPSIRWSITAGLLLAAATIAWFQFAPGERQIVTVTATFVVEPKQVVFTSDAGQRYVAKQQELVGLLKGSPTNRATIKVRKTYRGNTPFYTYRVIGVDVPR
jgi:hypothetical protein